MGRGFLLLLSGLFMAFEGVCQVQPPAPQIRLTEEQRKFIASRSPIRVGITPGYAPFSYFTRDKQAAGIDVDLLDLISQRTGLRFEIVSGGPPWEVLWRMAQEGKLDMTTSTVQTPERDKILKFTTPYLRPSTVIVSSADDHRFSNVALLMDARLAQPRNHLVSVALTNRAPNLKVLWFNNQKECFDAVQSGAADVTVANLFNAAQYMNAYPRAALGLSGVVPEFEFPVRIGVRHEFPILVDILNEALASISEQEMDAIIRRHLLFTLQAGERVSLLQRRMLLIVLGALLVVGSFVFWNYRIRQEVRTRRAAEQELRDINQSLEVFSHAIAHDLRTPLRAITGLSQAVEEDYGGKLDDTAHDYLHRIVAAAARMEALVGDVLAYSQASRGEFTMRDVDLKPLINGLLGELPPQKRALFEVASEMPIVRAHPALLGQCLSNLFSNALKFVPPERIPKIRIWAEQQNFSVRVWVEDNGIGIAQEDQERIFRLFQRSAHNFDGTGIGLAVVAKGVARMRGRAGVESQIDRGSRFWIELPKAQSEEVLVDPAYTNVDTADRGNRGVPNKPVTAEQSPREQ